MWLDLVNLRQPQRSGAIQSIAEPPRLCWCAGWSLGWWNFWSRQKSWTNRRSQALQRAFKGNKTFSLLVGAMGSRRLVSTREDWMGLQGPSCSRKQLLGLLPLCSSLGQSPPLPALKQGHTKGNVRELDAKRVISMSLGGTICQLSDSWSWQHHAAPSSGALFLVSFAAKGPFKALGIIVSQLLLGFCILSSFFAGMPIKLLAAFSFGFFFIFLCLIFFEIGIVLKPDLVWHFWGRHAVGTISGPSPKNRWNKSSTKSIRRCSESYLMESKRAHY